MIDLAEIKNIFGSKWYIIIETNSRANNTTVPAYQAVTLREIDDTVQKAKLRKILKKRKTLVWLGYVALIIFTIWFITGLDMDYFSHLGEDLPISP